MPISLTHKNPTDEYMFQDHYLGAKFHRSIVSEPIGMPGNIWPCVWRGQWTVRQATNVHSLGANESLRFSLKFSSIEVFYTI